MNTEQLNRHNLLSFLPVSTLLIYLRLHSLRKMTVTLMAEFNCSDCMRKNHKILLLLRALFWLVCSGSRCAQIAGFAVFDQLPAVDLKVMSTVAVQTVPNVMQILSCARIWNVGLFISHTEALFYAFRIYVRRFH
jgi:hypothetical protein